MKHIISILAVLAMAFSGYSQEYKGRFPQPQEQVRIAGLGYYPQDANEGQWLLYVIANSGTNIFLQVGQTNNVIVTQISAIAAQTNILVFPNPTNSIGAMFNIIVAGTTTTILSNAFGAATTIGFNNVTNPPGGGGAVPNVYQLNTNRAAKVFTPNGTNWFVFETKL
jgi:hypothetical protein